MKIPPKFHGVIEIPGDMELLTDSIGRVRLARYETQRQLNRLMATCLKSGKESCGFAEAYRAVLIQEKEKLLALLKRQLKGLNGIRPPKFILKQMNQDIRTVEKAISRLKSQSPARVAANLTRYLENAADKNALKLSTRFVGDAVVYDLLNGSPRGRAQVKRLMAG